MVIGVGLAPTLFLMWQIYSLRPSLLGDTQPFGTSVESRTPLHSMKSYCPTARRQRHLVKNILQQHLSLHSKQLTVSKSCYDLVYCSVKLVTTPYCAERKYQDSDFAGPQLLSFESSTDLNRLSLGICSF